MKYFVQYFIQTFQYNEILLTNILYFNGISCALMTMCISTLKYLLISVHNIISLFCAAPPEDDQVMLETYRGP
jgi:hypothetical protein